MFTGFFTRSLGTHHASRTRFELRKLSFVLRRILLLHCEIRAVYFYKSFTTSLIYIIICRSNNGFVLPQKGCDLWDYVHLFCHNKVFSTTVRTTGLVTCSRHALICTYFVKYPATSDFANRLYLLEQYWNLIKSFCLIMLCYFIDFSRRAWNRWSGVFEASLIYMRKNDPSFLGKQKESEFFDNHTCTFWSKLEGTRSERGVFVVMKF